MSNSILPPALYLGAKVMQTHLHDPPRSIGNCQRACLASMLGCDIDSLPAWEQIHYGDADKWWEAMGKACRARGVSLAYIRNGAPPVGIAMAHGISPRGTPHVVIVKDGALIHDPHPDGTGLVSIDGYEVLVSVHP